MTKTDKTERTSGLAIAGMILAVFALLGSWVPIINNLSFILAIISLIFGIFGFVSIKKGKRVGQGLAVATIILSVIAGGIVLATQSFFGKVADDVSSSLDESVSNSDGSNTKKLLETSVEVKLGEFVFNPGTEADFSYDDTTELPVTIKNKSSEKASYTVKIEALDASGSRVAEETIYVTDLAAGQSTVEKAFKYIETGKLEAVKAVTFKVFEVSK
jgi:hypothetical protein